MDTGPIEKRGDAHIEEKAHPVDEEEPQKLLPVTTLVIAECEVFVRKEDDHEGHTRRADVSEVRREAEHLNEEIEEREIDGRPDPSAHGEAQPLTHMLPHKGVMEKRTHENRVTDTFLHIPRLR
ncbi:hypothetical protein A3H22_04220 [Candidatus Peribacteria bacterium RIFCSPLOWO2_12_FULL_55_15]|nr:MAG: hypothetical protein A3H22_04220 [Candidatus Peribacteria bacterium RIFCSPLOWO2_12_FULL_55_15]